jgi:hypothetical protein
VEAKPLELEGKLLEDKPLERAGVACIEVTAVPVTAVQSPVAHLIRNCARGGSSWRRLEEEEEEGEEEVVEVVVLLSPLSALCIKKNLHTKGYVRIREDT